MIAKGFEREVGSLIRFKHQGHRDQTERTRRHRELRGRDNRRQRRYRIGRLVRLHAAAHGARPTAGAGRAADGQAIGGALQPGVQGGLQFRAASGNRTKRFTAASPIPICPSARSAIRAAATATPGKGVLLGGYTFGVHAYEFASLTPKERIAVGGVRRADPSAVQDRVRNWRLGGVAPRAVEPGCSGAWTDAACRTLRKLCLCHRRPHRAGR